MMGSTNLHVAQVESRIPRRIRCLLAQLRCGYSSHLNSYLTRIDKDNNNNCRNCFYDPRDDLCDQPVQVANWV